MSPPTTKPTPASTARGSRRRWSWLSGAKRISQFLDRDTRPDFASTVMILALQEFINKPNEIDSLLKSIESQKKNIFSS